MQHIRFKKSAGDVLIDFFYQQGWSSFTKVLVVVGGTFISLGDF